MNVLLIGRQKEIKHNKEIKEGLYYCPKCEVIMSAYYLRTYSIDCLRTANFGRCTKCSGEAYTRTSAKRLTKEKRCVKCNSRPSNAWGEICFETLIKMTLQDFINFCLISMKKQKKDFAISSETVVMLFHELSTKDFVSSKRAREAGLDHNQMAREMREARERLVSKNNLRVASH